jgi:hypothetical protein
MNALQTCRRAKPITPQISVLGPPHSNLLQRACVARRAHRRVRGQEPFERIATRRARNRIRHRGPSARGRTQLRPAYNFATVLLRGSPLSIQTKPAISQPGDQDEQEAD